MIIASFIVYIGLLLIIGFLAYKKTLNASDYFLGGRRLGKWVTALSAGASDMSQWLLMGLPGYAFASGFEVSWLLLGLILGTYFNWRMVAHRLRIYSEEMGDVLTLSSYFSQRFADPTLIIKLFSAVFILVFFTIYISSGFVAGAKLFNTTFDLPYHWALIVGVFIILLYTMFGGFLAVCWTDVLQASLMIIAITIVPVMVIMSVDDLSQRIGQLQNTSPEIFNAFTTNKGDPLSIIAVVSLLAWGLGYFGQPHILARFKAIHSAEEIPAARKIGVTWTVWTLICGALCGMIALVFFETGSVSEEETIFILLVNALFHPMIAGFLLAAILAAIMSTVDSQLLVFSSALSEDLLRGAFKKSVTDTQRIWIGRGGVALITVTAFIIALDQNNKIIDLVGFAWAGLGASFGPVLVMSLYWQRMNWQGATAGIFFGGITVLLWRVWGEPSIYEILPGIVISILAIVTVSLLTEPPSRQIKQMFQQVIAIQNRY